ncbi:MAG: hypothetical protein EXS31_14380 [Pedosphaera sp.]|nr:hypothetical protein [Pedosphaera sp.]
MQNSHTSEGRTRCREERAPGGTRSIHCNGAAGLRFLFRVLIYGLITLLASREASAAAELRWEKGPGYRHAALAVPAIGRTGFTELPASVTGISFTNHLSDAVAGSNRIFENGSGVALGDVDGDGWCDIYFCSIDGPNVLYRNRGDWKFEDITMTAGVACKGQHSTGAVLADVDGDGDLDLLVNSIGGGTRLFLNDGKGRFAEARNSGLVQKFGATSMALADVDGDGDLDLYVTNYRTTNYKDLPPNVKMEARVVDGKVIVKPEDRFFGLLSKRGDGYAVVEKGEADILYLNDGHGHFTPVPWTGGSFLDESGKPLTGPPLEWGLSAMFRDVNGDGFPDLYVCNDFFLSRDRLWLNDGRGRFRMAPPLIRRTMSMSSMSVDFADINRDGHDDFIIVDMLSRHHTLRQTQRANFLKVDLDLPISDPNYIPEVLRNTLFLNRGDNTYAEIAQLAGVGASEWSWSAIFLDVDLDGYEDLLLTTGNLHDVLDADATRALAAANAAGKKAGPALISFPRLETASIAFRNTGGLTFEDASAKWGFDSTGISQGMALADLDHDGDLDVVVNRMNRAAGIYRNESPARRLAVKLKGTLPNIQGIGARITVTGGSKTQTQEIISGGRYVSGDEPARTFAAGSGTNKLTIQVRWRSGGRSVIDSALADHLYEIDEASASPVESPKIPTPIKPLFEDFSHLLAHTHEDEPFDDFARQPSLPYKLSQLGPGVSWCDLNEDGREDLIVGGGRGGRPGVFLTAADGTFHRATNEMFSTSLARDQTTILGWHTEANGTLLLAGSSNYEDGLTNGAALKIFGLKNNLVVDGWHGQFSSVGPLVMADIDGDGDLDLFAGARMQPGRYPERASSRLYRNDNGRFRLDVENSKRFLQSGMISGAVFTDLDGDGDPDLVLACDWGPVRVFRNEGGNFTEATTELGLGNQLGRWNGVATGDFDEDGRIDIVASNWGRNTKYQSYLGKPLHLYHGALAGDGRPICIEAFHDEALEKIVPWMGLVALVQQLPFVQERFASYQAYGTASVGEILGDVAASAGDLQVNTLDSIVLLNRGDHFEVRPLPVEAQFAPAFGVVVGDLDGDGHEDLFLSQNFFGVEIETSRYDGGLGLVLLGDGKGGFKGMPATESGISIPGEQRGCALADYDGDGRIDLAVGQNRSQTKLYHNRTARPGLRVRISGSAGNPRGIGGTFRIGNGAKWGPVREVHLGGGYWSQDGTVQVLTGEAPPSRMEFRPPHGRPLEIAVPQAALEIQLDIEGKVTVTR